MSYQDMEEKACINLKHILLNERRQSENWLYDSNYMMFWKRQNYEDSKKMSGCQRLGRRRAR